MPTGAVWAGGTWQSPAFIRLHSLGLTSTIVMRFLKKSKSVNDQFNIFQKARSLCHLIYNAVVTHVLNQILVALLPSSHFSCSPLYFVKQFVCAHHVIWPPSQFSTV